jgi:hypothetical protein
VDIFEVRPQWNRPEVKREHAVAKATYVRVNAVWRVFWQRQDLKWHRYDPAPEVDSLEAFLQLINEDGRFLTRWAAEVRCAMQIASPEQRRAPEGER